MSPIKRIGIVALASAVFAAGAFVSGKAQAQDAPRGDAANGKRLYLAVGCFTCHGRSGQGGAYTGPAPSLASTAFPFEGFQGQIRDPSNDMPAYSARCRVRGRRRTSPFSTIEPRLLRCGRVVFGSPSAACYDCWHSVWAGGVTRNHK